ncbi:Fis family transcriptional regulator [Agarivorans sp. MS3-6]|uniref:Fis family transcriptional regulator n=1 Tax=Agarivorans sp. TSD2052 TaxID=2937286 RepID=UPI00200DD502|nr:Fis family transcriptional regulator [Agarivorans sp. TSD2052]UPW19730.1 Fis family transcriptional regulator [Agarivorans sp. TSD2052]
MDKKRDKDIVTALTEVCEAAKLHNEGFSWISHKVNYQRFPDSLQVLCVYHNRATLLAAEQVGEPKQLMLKIDQQLATKGIVLRNAKRQIQFDSE